MNDRQFFALLFLVAGACSICAWAGFELGVEVGLTRAAEVVVLEP